MDTNTNFHKVVGKSVSECGDSYYTEYRRQWHNNPVDDIVSDYPLFLDIEATSVCNLKCPHCVQTKAGFEKGFMEWDLFTRIIDEASEGGCYGCKFHTIGRGEPLLHKDIARMVAYAKKKGLIDIYLNTNGMLLSDKLSKKLLDAGLDRISFSVDGYTKEQYKKYRPGGNFGKVKYNIVNFLSHRDDGDYDCGIRIQSVHLPDIDFCKYGDFWIPFCDEVSIIDYKDMSTRAGDLRSNWICPQPWQRMSILFNGKLLPCNHDDREYAALGFLSDELSIGKAWRSSKMDFIRSAHRQHKAELLAACDGCFLRTSESKKEMFKK